MMDREKLMIWLEKCHGICNENTDCDLCPFSEAGTYDYSCAEQLKKALKRELLKAIRRELLKEEVVRCKDCIHLPHYDDEGKLQFPWDSPCPCTCPDSYYAWRPADDWFCANGERKEAQEDASD